MARAAARGPLDRLRAICLALPEANERTLARGADLVRGQGQGLRHAGRPPPRRRRTSRSGCPRASARQEALIESDPKRYFRPPYVGAQRLGRRRARHAARLDAVVAWLVEQAYRLVAHRRLVAQLPGAQRQACEGPVARPDVR